MTSTEIAPTPQAAVAASTLPAMAYRPRRLRRTNGLRRMVREHHLTVNDLIYPVFVMAGTGQKAAISSMPGCHRYTLDLLLEEVTAAYDLGIPGIALFPLIAPDLKDNAGTESYNPEGLVP
ncbi:MAG: porphobilinogen synthase, partial [Cyanobacteria bacterium P01_D01_bin.115]